KLFCIIIRSKIIIWIPKYISMAIYFQYPLFLSILLLCSCHSQNSAPDPRPAGMIIKTKPNRAEKILAKDLYKDLHYIRLESHENALVGQRHRTKLFDNHIGVLNLNPRNFILFDRQGNYLLNIDAQCKEPGNLSSTYDFTILDDKIYFSNHINKSVSIYATDGKYQKTIPADHSYMGLSRTKNHIVASS